MFLRIELDIKLMVNLVNLGINENIETKFPQRTLRKIQSKYNYNYNFRFRKKGKNGIVILIRNTHTFT